MLSLKNIKTETKEVSDIQKLLEVYEEIVAVKMQGTRGGIISSREYYEGLSRIAEEVALDLSENNRALKEEAVLFLSADEGLYGDIVDKVLVDFVNYTRRSKGDVFVVGKLGISLLKVYSPHLRFDTFDIPIEKNSMDESTLKLTMQKLADYKKVTIFHGKFRSLAAQESVNTNISGGKLAEIGADFDENEESRIRLKNLYEPSISVVGGKFSKEISGSILSQSFSENQLAKYAARLMHLDSALTNIDQKISDLGQKRRRISKKNEQKKQTERIARMSSLKKFV